MGTKRLLLELIGALLLVRFAMAIGGVSAEEAPCAQGLPALAAEGPVLEHDSDGVCAISAGVESLNGGSDGRGD